MKKVFIIIIAVVIVLLAGFSFYTLEQANDNRVVYKVGTSADNKPYEFFQNGEIVGFDIDLIHAIAREMGIEIVIIDMDFTALIPAVHSGRIDLSIAGFVPTPERLKQVDFSIPYFESRIAIISPKNNQFSSFEDLANKTVGLQLGSAYETTIKNQNIPDLDLRLYNRIPEMIQELKSGIGQQDPRIEAIIIGEAEAKAITEKEPQLVYVTLPLSDSPGIIFKKDSPLVKPVNQAIESLRRSGVIDLLEKKWNLHDSNNSEKLNEELL